jgi:hypothetical protein
MAKITMQPARRITAWSFSRWKEYEQCPLKAKLKVLDKLRGPQGPALARGTAVHTDLENYLSQPKTKLPSYVHKDLRKPYAAIKKQEPQVELELAFDSKWGQVGWYDSAAWCRVKIDAMSFTAKDKTVRVYDHKTGKVNDTGEYDAQLELYMLSGLLTHANAQQSRAQMMFTDHGVIVEADAPIARRAVEKAKDQWVTRTRAMLNDTVFSPRPGGHCRWCAFQKSRGGQCPY